MTTTADGDLDHLRGELQTAWHTIEQLEESFADLARAEDGEWVRLGGIAADEEFDRTALDRITANSRVMAVASPLVKRGLMVRSGYVWGTGVEIAARDGLINELVQEFLADDGNRAALTSSTAQEENERSLGTDGNVFLACFTDRATGRVQVRTTPFAEVRDIITNPEDRDEPWFYLREYRTTVREAGYGTTTRSRVETRRVLHPEVGFRPASRPRSVDGIPVEWDAPMIHVAVNRLDGWKFGIPDVYAALPWARAYEGFLTDWSKLVKSLSRFAWRVSADRPSKASRAARSIQTLPTGADGVGDAAVHGPGAHLEAIPKTGASIDSGSGRPLASMVAAALGLPVTTLLADPGTTGARAVAETLDLPTRLEMGQRRTLWESVYQRVTSYVVDAAVIAPRGPLTGRIERLSPTRQRTRLPEGVERSITVEWPDLDRADVRDLVWAITAADATRKLPPQETARLLLSALGVKDVDEVMEQLVDDNGEWIGPEQTAGDVAVRAFRRGEDPAEAVR